MTARTGGNLTGPAGGVFSARRKGFDPVGLQGAGLNRAGIVVAEEEPADGKVQRDALLFPEHAGDVATGLEVCYLSIEQVGEGVLAPDHLVHVPAIRETELGGDDGRGIGN